MAVGPLSIQNNYAGVGAPSVANDNTQGYDKGSVWVQATTRMRWVCNDAATGAAVWTRTDLADFFGYVSGRFYTPIGVDAITTSTTFTALSLRMFPTIIKERVAITSLGLRVITTSAGGNAQCAIYASDPATKYPTGLPLVSTANLSTATAATVSGAVSVTLEPGLYWFATMCDNTTATFAAGYQSSKFAMQMVGSTVETNALLTFTYINYSVSYTTYGTWPNLTSVTPTETANASAQTPLVRFGVGTAA